MRAPFLLLATALLALLTQGMEATEWKVGGSKGWQLNVDFQQWTSGKVFEVGDILLFSYNKSSENLLAVSEADYASCTTIDPIAMYTDGNTSVRLTNFTTRFFISGIPGHCLAGMTLQIHVGSPSPTPSPAAAPTPASSSSPSPSTSISPTQVPASQQPQSPPPPPPNSSPGPAGCATRMAILLAVYVVVSLVL